MAWPRVTRNSQGWNGDCRSSRARWLVLKVGTSANSQVSQMGGNSGRNGLRAFQIVFWLCPLRTCRHDGPRVASARVPVPPARTPYLCVYLRIAVSSHTCCGVSWFLCCCLPNPRQRDKHTHATATSTFLPTTIPDPTKEHARAPVPLSKHTPPFPTQLHLHHRPTIFDRFL